MGDHIYKFEQGSTLKDVITGFEGVVTGRANFISGCNRYLLCVRNKTEKREDEWFDEQRLELVPGERILLQADVAPGADRDATPR